MSSDSMKVFSENAFQCLNDDRKLRPSIGLVLKKLEKALNLLDKEEAPELLELEEALEVKKLVETLQIQELEEALGLYKLVETLQLQQFREACELQELEEALGLCKLVETLQRHEYEETLKLQEAWKFQKLVGDLEFEIGASRIDYEVLKAIYDMPDNPLSYVTSDQIFSHLTRGILVDNGKVEEIDVEKSALKNLSTSNVEWNNVLPSDYKQYIYYSNREMMNTPQTDVTFPTKEEAYSILSRGVLIKVNNEVNMWFWITKLDGKKCFMLPPTLVSYNERLVKIKRIPSKESRIENVVHLSPSKVVGMRFEVPTSLLSSNTTYGCYLVYKMQQHFAWESMVTMKLDDGRTLLGEQHGKLITYLTMPQSPVIGPQGVCSSPRSINQMKTVQLPRKRKDGWLDIQWMNMRPNKQYDHFCQRENLWKSCLFPCLRK